MDAAPQDEDRGFYAETFYSSAWVYQGDDNSGEPPPSLNSRTRAVSSQFASHPPKSELPAARPRWAGPSCTCGSSIAVPLLRSS